MFFEDTHVKRSANFQFCFSIKSKVCNFNQIRIWSYGSDFSSGTSPFYWSVQGDGEGEEHEWIRWVKWFIVDSVINVKGPLWQIGFFKSTLQDRNMQANYFQKMVLISSDFHEMYLLHIKLFPKIKNQNSIFVLCL